jgi:O-antigen/teichoic acid export membrane protein
LLGGALVALGVLDLAVSKEKAIFLALCILPLWVWVLLNREFQRGLKLLTPALIGFQILRPGLAMLFTSAAYVLGSSVGSTSALAYLGGALAIIVVNDARQINKVLGPANGKLIYETDKWLQTAKPLLFSMVMYTIVTRADMLMVGALLGMEEAARYSVASRLAAFPDFLLEAIRIVVAPVVAEYYHRNDLALLQKHVTRASQLVFLAVVPFAAAFVGFPKFFLGLFGAAYQSADRILIYLIAGQCINALCGTVAVLMTMTNLQREHAYIVSAGAITMLVLGFVLIKISGAEGAAMAVAVTMSLTNIAMVIAVKRKLGIMSYMKISRTKRSSRKIAETSTRSEP